MGITWTILGAVVFIILISIKQINQYEKGVKFCLGKYVGLMEPCWRMVWPIFYSYKKVDLQVKAAETLATAPGALHLRTLQSINDISSDKSNTIVFAVPLEILRAFEGMASPRFGGEAGSPRFGGEAGKKAGVEIKNNQE